MFKTIPALEDAGMQLRTPSLESFVDALASQDFERLQATLAPRVFFHALIPPGTRAGNSAADTRSVIEGWFGACKDVELLWTRFDTIGDRQTATYRLSFIEDGRAYLCEQHVFATPGEEGIERLDILCSGFRPV